jgi:PD-(D/E)XK nuclease superfamily
MTTQTPDRLNQITSSILSAAIDIHRTLGPGLFERAYLTCLTRDLADAHLRIEVQKAIVGLLLNFSAPTMKAGIKRIVNNFPET